MNEKTTKTVYLEITSREDEKKWIAYVAAMSMSRSGIGEA